MQESGPDGEVPAEGGTTPGFGAGRPVQTLTRRERALVLDRIQALMSFWNISIDELGDSPAAASAPGQAALPPRFVKYRHPVTGATWDGEGAQPDWLRRALLQEGLRVDELRPPPA